MWKTIAGQEVLFNKKKGDFFGLNETAALLLKSTLELGLEKTVKEMSKTFQIPDQELTSDIKELLASLTSLDLVEIAERA